MALRHHVADFRPSFEQFQGPEQVLSRMPKSLSLEFRSGADLSHVVEAILSNKILHVDAAAGAGKSTVLPTMIAAKSNMLVLHVLPNQYLACDTADYCMSLGQDVMFMEKLEQDFPQKGVVCIAASLLVAKWLETGQVYLPPCIVYHDESHESDAYTDVVRRLAVTAKSVKSYVTASATALAAGFRAAETGGETVEVLLEQSEFDEEWDEYEHPAWGVEVLEGHMLIFEDSKANAETLAQKYRLAGMIVHRFHAKMALSEFRLGMREMRDPSSPLVVIIADYAFRSGFTFPVARVIDTAKVHYISVEDGRPIRRVRYAYELECYQAKHRGGRMRGQKTMYYRPNVDYKSMICDLEAVEVDAAALIIRLLGFSVPRQLMGASTVTGKVPRELPRALRGFTPLACLQESLKVEIEEFFKPSGRRSPFLKQGYEFNTNSADLQNNSISSETAYKHGAGGIVPSIAAVTQTLSRWEVEQEKLERQRSDSCVEAAGVGLYPTPLQVSKVDDYDHASRMVAVSDTINAFVAHDDSVDSIEVGGYYYATGLLTDKTECSSFPDGHVSVCRWMARDLSESGHLGLTPFERSVAINALLARYNIKTCEMRVYSAAIPAARQAAVGKDLGALRVWATEMSEHLVSVVADLRIMTRYILRLVVRFCGLARMPPLLEHEESGRRRVLKELDKLPSASVGPPAVMMETVRDQWDRMSIGRASTISDGSVKDEVGIGLSNVYMPTSGRGMRAIATLPTEIQSSVKRAKYVRLDTKGRKAHIVRTFSNG